MTELEDDSPFRTGDRVLFQSSPGYSYEVLAVLPDLGQDAYGHSKINGFSYTLRNKTSGAICQGHQFSLALDTRVHVGGGYGWVQNPSLSQLTARPWGQPSPRPVTSTGQEQSCPSPHQQSETTCDTWDEEEAEDKICQSAVTSAVSSALSAIKEEEVFEAFPSTPEWLADIPNDEDLWIPEDLSQEVLQNRGDTLPELSRRQEMIKEKEPLKGPRSQQIPKQHLVITKDLSQEVLQNGGDTLPDISSRLEMIMEKEPLKGPRSQQIPKQSLLPSPLHLPGSQISTSMRAEAGSQLQAWADTNDQGLADGVQASGEKNSQPGSYLHEPDSPLTSSMTAQEGSYMELVKTVANGEKTAIKDSEVEGKLEKQTVTSFPPPMGNGEAVAIKPAIAGKALAEAKINQKRKSNSLRSGLKSAKLACLPAPVNQQDLERSTSTPLSSCDKENKDPVQLTLAELLQSLSPPHKPQATRPNLSRLHRTRLPTPTTLTSPTPGAPVISIAAASDSVATSAELENLQELAVQEEPSATQKLLQELLSTPSTYTPSPGGDHLPPAKADPRPRQAQLSYQEQMAETESLLDEGLEDLGMLKTVPREQSCEESSSGHDHLEQILRRVERPEETQAGLQELYAAIVADPSLDMEPYLCQSSKYFRDYIARGLTRIQQEDPANQSPVKQAMRKSVDQKKILAKQVRTTTAPDTDDLDNDDHDDHEPDDHVSSMDPSHDLVHTVPPVAPAKRKSVVDKHSRHKFMAVDKDMPTMTESDASEDDDDVPLLDLTKKNTNVKKTKKKKHTSKPPKFLDDDIPYNPHNLQYQDAEGNDLTPGSSAFLSKFSNSHKLTKRTQARYTMEHNRFERFTAKYAGAQALASYQSSALPPQQVAELVSDYLVNRINLKKWRKEGVKEYLDTTTARLVWAKLSRVMRQKTNYNMTTMPAFKSSKESLATYLSEAKEVPGLGENAGQASGLSRIQLSYLLHHDYLSLYTPVGLVSLFYITFVITFLPRVREEAKRVTRGDFRRIYNADGTIRCIVYCPRGKCKRDRGARGGEQGAAVFKRPIALPSKEPKISFPVILDTMEAHLDLLPWDGDRSEQPMFMMFHTSTPKAGESFFMSRELGKNKFDDLMKNVIRSTGLKTNPNQQCNQALRPTAFGIHKLLGLDTSYFQSMAGHCSGRTHTLYVRNQVELLEGVTGNFLEATTGVEAVRPTNDTVEIFDPVTERTEVRRVKDFLPLVTHNGRQQGIFPLSGMGYDELYTLLPEVRDESDEPYPVQPEPVQPVSTNPSKPRPSAKFISPSNNNRLQAVAPLDLSPARQPSGVDLSCSVPLNLVTPPSRSRQTSLQSTSDPGPSSPTNTVSRRSDFSFKRPRVALTTQLPLTTYAPQNFSPISLMENLSPSKQKGLNLTSPTTQQPL